MIAEAIINIFYYLLKGLVKLFPHFDNFSDQLSTALTFFWGDAYKLNSFFPVDTIFTLLGLALGFELAVILWSMIKWVGGFVFKGFR